MPSLDFTKYKGSGISQGLGNKHYSLRGSADRASLDNQYSKENASLSLMASNKFKHKSKTMQEITRGKAERMSQVDLASKKSIIDSKFNRN